MPDFNYVVMGNPISHSMSPTIQNLFAKSMGNQDICYGTLLVPEGKFTETADAFFADKGCGCNITLPCKLDAFTYADKLTDYAKRAGAVNALKKLPDGSVLGDNTDGRGFVADLKRLGFSLKNERVLILGAGGAAKGIVFPILEQQPESLTIVNRTPSKASDIAKDYPGRISVSTYEELTGSFDIIINATSASISQKVPPVPKEAFANTVLAYDLMYSKDGQKTVFMQMADSLGVKNTFDGWGMLIMQAALSYELWHGIVPDVAEAFATLR